MTCPVILMQFSKLFNLVGYKMLHQTENFIIILDQIMIVAGAFGAVSSGAQKWIFFILAFSSGMGLFGTMWFMMRDNFLRFPEGSRSGLKLVACLFFFSWGSFPALWVLGAPGLNIIDQDTDVIMHCIADFISKNLFGFAAWYLRWNLIAGNSIASIILWNDFVILQFKSTLKEMC